MAIVRILTLSAALSLIASTVQSHFIQDDVLAFPRYKVVVTKDKIANTDSSLLRAREDTDLNHIIMTSSYGQPFSCIVPDVQIEEERLDREKKEAAKEETEQDRQKIIEKGLELLEPLAQTSCIRFFASTNQYWAYEYCHNRWVRQFHIERTHDGKAEKEFETASFYLGFHPGSRQQMTDLQTKQYSNNKGALLAKGSTGHLEHTNEPERRDANAFTELKTMGDQRYLVQKWKDGSVCDLTEKPRTIEVQYHCDLHGQDRVSSFVETSTCNYQIIISTPRLCEEMNLSRKHHVEPHKIECRPIVPEELIEEERQKEAERLLIHQAAASDTEDRLDDAKSEMEMDHEARTKEAGEINEVPAAATAVKDEKEILLGLISELTDQISQLKHQVDSSSKVANNKDKHTNKQVKTEITFYTMDEDGNIIQQDPSLLSDKLTLQDLIKESFLKDPSFVEEEDKKQKMRAKEQHNNRQAYQQRYFD